MDQHEPAEQAQVSFRESPGGGAWANAWYPTWESDRIRVSSPSPLSPWTASPGKTGLSAAPAHPIIQQVSPESAVV